MTESSIPDPEEQLPETPVTTPTEQQKLYHISFRTGQQPKAALSKIQDLAKGETVMVQTDHGQEPAQVCGSGIMMTPVEIGKPLELLTIMRRASTEELGKFQNLLQRERDARRYCQGKISELGLEMKLLQVERYFNGSKVIFYFSAETRVDFRDLVKSLVQEFRTRVEMRQIGVRHETQMLGGIGCCGRELCCGLFMKDFVPVSIKMAKEQDLPLNPAKISGVCNRLLCCLTHEYETYKALKKGMPKVGRVVTFDEKSFKVNSCKTLTGAVSITAVDDPSDSRVLTREEWERGTSTVKGRPEGDERPPAPRPGPPVPASSRQPGGNKPQASRPQTERQPPAPRQPGPGKQSPQAKPTGQPRPQAPTRQPGPPQQTPVSKPAARGQGRPGPPKGESGRPGPGPGAEQTNRPRRPKGNKRGKTP